MKLAVYSRPGAHTGHEIADLFDALSAGGFDYSVNRELAGGLSGCAVPSYGSLALCDGDTAMAVSYGGDGTFLECVRLLGRRPLPVLGINSGRLGFLANVPKGNMRRALADIAAGRYTTSERMLLRVGGDLPAGVEPQLAFNEVSVQRSTGGMISVEAYVDGEMVARYWGDGVLVSTPAGSTAYSLSVGGPVVAPGCACMVIAPIAPHNLSMRPVVLPEGSTVSLKVATRSAHALATVDNTQFEIADGARLSVSKSESSVRLVALDNMSFYDTLRNKLMWGIDPRDGAKGVF